MKLALEELQREAAATGFLAETLEKALRLLSLLNALRSHPFLRTRVALKGGTALNLFVFDVPRLSVDIDFNYVGAVEREVMLAERPKVEQAVQAVCGREGIAVRLVPGEHAGGKWRLMYTSATGRSANLDLDINFLLRVSLWPTAAVDSRPVGSYRASGVRMLDLHEIAGGKLAALVARTASRDLFDARELLRLRGLDPARLRLAFVVYGGANRKDWRSISVDDVRVDVAEVQNQLLPVLRIANLPGAAEVSSWADRLVSECRDLVSMVLPLTAEEREFIERLNERGEIVPELLTTDSSMQQAIRTHPALRWKAINVRKHRGLPQDKEE
ncbi:MAG: nucleotidyl transferase AbiEii/AbiGii toxin family protein [Deltaproteobacteria bacterium]|nr:nucleotidyl transferase AbiEii/AbiGii toxin family protein [Deltaproteobacteria bacterium]